MVRTGGETERHASSLRSSSRAWQGWAFFGGGVMALLGMFWAGLGLVALSDEQYFTVRTNELLALHSYVSWGWVHLVGGLLSLAAGVGILWGGHRWARLAGIVVVGLSAVVNLGFLAAAPVWTTLVIALDLVMILALTVHGREIEER
jgi:hypothetical protein